MKFSDGEFLSILVTGGFVGYMILLMITGLYVHFSTNWSEANAALVGTLAAGSVAIGVYLGNLRQQNREAERARQARTASNRRKLELNGAILYMSLQAAAVDFLTVSYLLKDILDLPDSELRLTAPNKLAGNVKDRSVWLELLSNMDGISGPIIARVINDYDTIEDQRRLISNIILVTEDTPPHILPKIRKIWERMLRTSQAILESLTETMAMVQIFMGNEQFTGPTILADLEKKVLPDQQQ
jgi:hypothetical protein